MENPARSRRDREAMNVIAILKKVLEKLRRMEEEVEEWRAGGLGVPGNDSNVVN